MILVSCGGIPKFNQCLKGQHANITGSLCVKKFTKEDLDNSVSKLEDKLEAVSSQSDSDKRILAAVSSAKKNLKTESNIGLPIVIIMFLCLLVLSKITQKNSFPKLYFLYFNFFCLLRAVNKTNNG
ncbi:MAG: hypothetical protein IKO99_05065 [Bacteroidales bacterium]|nr:hypothetical protein [Bacteroidales bacterium]